MDATPQTAVADDDIRRKLDELMRCLPRADPRERVTVGEAVDQYLANVADEKLTPETLADRVRDLGAFRAAHGHKAVGELTPLDYKRWLSGNSRRWPSGCTKARINAAAQRALNWAVVMGLIRENPLRGFSAPWERRVGRDMKPEEFQAALRFSDPPFRRFLVALRLTGARPGELRVLRWEHIDWQLCVATLPTHKTQKKTKRPRVIVLVPAMVKLLQVIRRDHAHGPPAVELRRLLTAAPGRTLPAREVVTRMKQMGFTDRALHCAKLQIGAVYRRPEPDSDGVAVYELPAGAEPPPPPSGHVFLSGNCRPWGSRQSLGQAFRRLRERIGLPDDCKLYGLRHYFATDAVRKDVNMKAVADLMGHASTAMLEKVYCHTREDYEFLQKAARAATALKGTPTPMPLPTEPAWAQVLAARYPKREPKRRKPKRTGPRPLRAAERAACESYQWAVRTNPALADATDRAVFDWLMAQEGVAAQLPRRFETWRRYVRCGRQADGAPKRGRPRQGFTPPAAASPETTRPDTTITSEEGVDAA